MAAVLGVSGVIKLDSRTVYFPGYTRKHHKYPVLDSHSSKVFIPHFEALSAWYCLIDIGLSRVTNFHQWQSFALVDIEFEIFCSRDISRDKF
jgi:hypothetical protein